jgi:hypothetical protein
MIFFFSPAFFTFSPQIPLFRHKSRIFARPALLFASLYVRKCPLHQTISEAQMHPSADTDSVVRRVARISAAELHLD